MTSSLDEKKDLASQWFRSLRDQFCNAFEELDGGEFERKNGIIKVLAVVK